MPAHFKKTAAFLTFLHTQFRSLAHRAEPDPVDYPFAPSDIAQLLRITRQPDAALLDEPTWNGLLLDPYFGRAAVLRGVRQASGAAAKALRPA